MKFRKKMRRAPEFDSIPEGLEPQEEENLSLTSDLSQNEQVFGSIFHGNTDIIYRHIRKDGEVRWLVIYFSSLVDEKAMNDHIIAPLVAASTQKEEGTSQSDEMWDENLISIGKTMTSRQVSDIIRYLLNGHAAIFAKGTHTALVAQISGIAKRSLEESSSEPVIRGPKDGFIENIYTNIGLIRNRLKTSRLKMESMIIGELTQTNVVITYITGLASEEMIDSVKSKLAQSQTDGILESGYIEEFIEEYSFSPFPQVNTTERPDVVVAALLDGKIAILVDTTPFVLIVPMTFWGGMQASEDFYNRKPIATFVRWIRFFFITIAIFAPPLYVAITTYHQEMIPTNLVLSIASSREDVPFPALIEAMFTEIVFEALREAGIRLPKQLGSAISIIGALVIGQAAVEAGIISAPVVIIVSITGIAAFTIPRYSFANGIRLLRFPMLILAGTLGLYGIVLGFVGIVIHVMSLRSFGVPYFSPIFPFTWKSLKRLVMRQPKIKKPRPN
ncbi:spore germination protein [Paenibacillus sp. GCM10023248]|uniref:spore germination protein n=1 Tax=unclassified Paenibacillus TaxID=185978 RepID=UPI0023798513|nr:spore germination protein [Paenibacillus sp. MAHUQ-63]MDD9268480.1 spore germination protein [Paenibacillus sp. MAHUQ-63]